MLSFDPEQQSKNALQIAAKIPLHCWEHLCYCADNQADICVIQVKGGRISKYIEGNFKAFLNIGDHLANKVTSKGPYIPNDNFVRRGNSFEIRGRGLLENFADYYRRFGKPKQK
jgi:hypothetical protein